MYVSMDQSREAAVPGTLRAEWSYRKIAVDIERSRIYNLVGEFQSN
jgi:hypothetical protein